MNNNEKEKRKLEDYYQKYLESDLPFVISKTNKEGVKTTVSR